MTVFRVEKNANYTVMSNEHLRNRGLSLKAKGLLSQMLSLPEGWDYSLEGLSRINREGVDAIRTGIRELEEHGYLERRRLRDGSAAWPAPSTLCASAPSPGPRCQSPTSLRWVFQCRFPLRRKGLRWRTRGN